LIFAALKRIRKNNLKSLNADSAVFFHDRGVLSDWEYQFTQDTMNKRSLSRKQAEQRKRINQKVLDALARRGFQGPD
jgi:predicted hydrolase (HD superfamily)